MNSLTRNYLEKIYRKYNNSKYAVSDPVQFIYKYKTKTDTEIAALISSSLAYGNVKQIIGSLNKIFSIIKSPTDYIKNKNLHNFKKDFSGFKHRFTNSNEIVNFLLNIKHALSKYQTLENLFYKYYRKSDKTIYICMKSSLKEFLKFKTPTMIPDPEKNSSFKRMNLFLRWMIRKDNIDIGIWKRFSPSKLLIPLDTHMHQIAKKFQITQKNTTTVKTAEEITDYFRKINPDDPVKYDFALTREPILENFKDKIYIIN